MTSIKLQNVAVGRRYVGDGGEIREVKRIFKHYGGLVFLDWVSPNRHVRGKLATGRTSPEMFAKWAQREHP